MNGFIKQKPKSNKENHVSYKRNTTLSEFEISAISHYKDLINPQYKWDYKPVIPVTVGIDCNIINGFLRGNISKKLLSNDDLKRVSKLIDLISSAINSNKTEKTLSLIKGLSNPTWIKKYKVSDIYKESAFGSYTTSKTIAKNYAMEWKRGKPTYLSLELLEGSRALYLGKEENEWLLPKNMIFSIDDIVDYGNAIVYYLREV